MGSRIEDLDDVRQNWEGLAGDGDLEEARVHDDEHETYCGENHPRIRIVCADLRGVVIDGAMS